MNLNGKVAFITGASSGIGFELAKKFHSEGCKLILIARREKLLSEMCEKFNQLRSDSAKYLCVDLADLESNSENQKKLAELEIDILVNNAGFGLYGEFKDSELSQNIEMVRTNINATLILLSIFIPQLIKKKSGNIVSLSSMVATLPAPLMSTYCATKAFNLYHSLALKEELKRFGIKVLVVRPGPTTTEFGKVAGVSSLATNFGGSAENCATQIITAIKKSKSLLFTGPGTSLLTTLSNIFPLSIRSTLVGFILKRIKKDQKDLS